MSRSNYWFRSEVALQAQAGFDRAYSLGVVVYAGRKSRKRAGGSGETSREVAGDRATLLKPDVHELDTNVEAFRRRPDQVVGNAELIPLGRAALCQGPAGYRTAVAHINIGPEQDRTDGWGEVVLESPHNRPACR